MHRTSSQVFNKGAELGEMLDEQSVAVSSIQHKAVVEVSRMRKKDSCL
jgi:hypothetical protein